MKPQPCAFCGEPLINYRRVVSQPNTGCNIHLDCYFTIQRLKRKRPDYLNSNDKLYKQITYIHLNSKQTCQETLVYQ